MTVFLRYKQCMDVTAWQHHAAQWGLLLFAVFMCSQAFGRERSEAEQIRIAAEVLEQSDATGAMFNHVAKPRYATYSVLRRLSKLSVVGSSLRGFVIVGNDDGVRPVLGYSKTGRFDAENLPCGMEWYLQALDSSLQQRGDVLEAMFDSVAKPRHTVEGKVGVKERVEPLIQTDWYQTAPFNDWLPTYTDEKGVTKHFFTGCGMTATAQVMYYYKHPLKPNGKITYSYDPFEDGNPIEISCDLDTMTFDWNHIATTYNNQRSANERENIEVARLFLSVDFALNALYRPSGTPGLVLTTTALPQNFGYSADNRWMVRNYYNDELWMKTIFDELSNGRPIIYQGRNPDPEIDSSHAFILDGYDENGLVHINWGWGRVIAFDGYFSIDALKPNYSQSDFTDGQIMYVHIRPDGQPINFYELTVTQPGSLGTMLRDIPFQSRLKISGHINADDLLTLRQLGRGMLDGDSLIVSELTHLDLSAATIEDNTLPDSAFCNCRQLLQLTLPTALQRIGSQAFRGCTALRQLQLPSTITDIGSLAFLNCTNLTTLTMPRSLTTLSPSAFGGTIRLESFGVEEGNQHFATIDGILTDTYKRKLVAYPEARTEAVIPASIDTIGSYAFYYCYNLKQISIPKNVRVVCDNAFISCQNLEKLTLAEGVQRILATAFNNCQALTSLYLPASIDSIGRRLFVNCLNMQQVTMSEENPHFRVENNCLLSHDGKQLVQALLTEVETVDIPPSVETIERAAFFWSKISHLIIPSTIRKIDSESIYFCVNLANLDIEEGIEEISAYAFNGCSALTEVYLPASLKTIGSAIFVNCTGLRRMDISEASEVFHIEDNMLFSKDGSRLLQQLLDDREEYVIPSTVTAVGAGCFRYLNKLQRLTIPATVSSIGAYQLYGCTALRHVDCLATMPLNISEYVFSSVDLSTTTLHVPEGCRYAYSVSTGWKQFGNIVDDLPYTPLLQKKYQYDTTFSITRSSQTACTKLVIVAPCPQTNEYQDVHTIDHTSNGLWMQHDIQENQNKYLELSMNTSQLASASQDFTVGYSYTLTHKSIFIDFSPLKNPDGSWKDIPPYDTSQPEYIDNTKQSGDYVVPGNTTIKAIADQLFSECGNNRLAYAEKCYEYVADHFKYLNPGTGLHTLSDILSDGGGDCGNLSSIYISLLRAKGIPARHVVAVSSKAENNGYSGHVWSEFYIQDFGWVPVDVSYKNGHPKGNYFGVYDGNDIVVQKGVCMDYPISSIGTKTLNILQLFGYWYWYSTPATLKIEQNIVSHEAQTTGITETEETTTQHHPRKLLKQHRLLIQRNGRQYNAAGLLIF